MASCLSGRSRSGSSSAKKLPSATGDDRENLEILTRIENEVSRHDLVRDHCADSRVQQRRRRIRMGLRQPLKQVADANRFGRVEIYLAPDQFAQPAVKPDFHPRGLELVMVRCNMSERPTTVEPSPSFGVSGTMERRGPALDWPAWATWALLAVIVSAIVTVAATINDINIL
jgi:hypothetical protein